MASGRMLTKKYLKRNLAPASLLLSGRSDFFACVLTLTVAFSRMTRIRVFAEVVRTPSDLLARHQHCDIMLSLNSYQALKL